MLKDCIEKLMRKEHLTAETMASVLMDILATNNEAQTAAFLTLLRAKGETAEEIVGLVNAMDTMMITVDMDCPTLDIVGTGGDGMNTVNISTGAALLAASCGVRVAKHGNRSVSSLCGSADVLESLGVNIDLSPAEISDCILSTYFGFLYAPNFHPAMGRLKNIRKNLGIPTVFNVMGPLLNPLRAQYLMIGVADPSYLKLISDVLVKRNCQRALIFNCCGLDEIACVGPTDIIEINQADVCRYALDPAEYGFERCSIEAIQGGSPEENAKIIISVLKGDPGPVADTLILNAGLANTLYGLCDNKKEGIAMARDAHAKGKGYQLLQQLVSKTNRFQKFSEKRHA